MQEGTPSEPQVPPFVSEVVVLAAPCSRLPQKALVARRPLECGIHGGEDLPKRPLRLHLVEHSVSSTSMPAPLGTPYLDSLFTVN